MTAVPLLLVAAAWLLSEWRRTGVGGGGEGTAVGEARRRLLDEQRRYEAIVRRRTEELRGLKFLRPVKVEWLKRKDIGKYISGLIDELYTPTRLDGVRAAFVAFDLIGEGDDIRRIFSRLYSATAGGFYDHRRDVLYRVPGVFAESILAHEYTHALQDQHFDLSRLPLQDVSNDDAALAAACLVEGDAMIVTNDYVQRFGDPSAVPSTIASALARAETRDVPSFFLELVGIPYRYGLSFVREIKKKGGWKAVDALYARPPASTEQVMHPDRRDDAPVPVKERSALEALRKFGGGVVGTRMLHSSVMGECGVWLMLKRRLAAAAARRAAAGWGGDRYWVYRRGGRGYVVVWISVWDSKKDAAECFDALSRYFRIDGAPSTRRDGERGIVLSCDGGRRIVFVRVLPLPEGAVRHG